MEILYNEDDPYPWDEEDEGEEGEREERQRRPAAPPPARPHKRNRLLGTVLQRMYTSQYLPDDFVGPVAVQEVPGGWEAGWGPRLGCIHEARLPVVRAHTRRGGRECVHA